MMLKNVKSMYFSKIIFSYINDKRILEIVKNNKELQNNLDINLNNYKLFSGKYIIFEENGKGKEYNLYHNELVFEGEYKDGKKNGKGKEYYRGSLYFEGEYLNGKKHGEGKEYEIYENMLFEGEYKNGKKWNGKGYHKNQLFPLYQDDIKLVYELKDGKGIFKRNDISNVNLLIEGEYLNGELNGKCKEYFEDGNLSFEGEYKNGKRWNGKGYDINHNIVYELNNGKGYIKQYKLNYDKDLIYEGYILNGEKNGIGKEYCSGNLIFEGVYKDGKKNGKGKEYERDTGELIFEGEYLYDYRNKGKEYVKGRLEYEGQYFFYQKWDGNGYDENGNIIYTLKNGSGKVKNYNSYNGELVFDGQYLNGKIHGMIKEYSRGKIYLEGEYINGKKTDLLKNILMEN